MGSQLHITYNTGKKMAVEMHPNPCLQHFVVDGQKVEVYEELSAAISFTLNSSDKHCKDGERDARKLVIVGFTSNHWRLNSFSWILVGASRKLVMHVTSGIWCRRFQKRTWPSIVDTHRMNGTCIDANVPGSVSHSGSCGDAGGRAAGRNVEALSKSCETVTLNDASLALSGV